MSSLQTHRFGPCLGRTLNSLFSPSRGSISKENLSLSSPTSYEEYLCKISSFQTRLFRLCVEISLQSVYPFVICIIHNTGSRALCSDIFIGSILGRTDASSHGEGGMKLNPTSVDLSGVFFLLAVFTDLQYRQAVLIL